MKWRTTNYTGFTDDKPNRRVFIRFDSLEEALVARVFAGLHCPELLQFLITDGLKKDFFYRGDGIITSLYRLHEDLKQINRGD